MPVSVCKFGGSSLANAEQVRKALDIIRADPARRYVVVSAPGKRDAEDTKVTDLLYRAHRAARAGDNFQPLLDRVRERFIQMCDGLGLADRHAMIDAAVERIAGDLAASARPDYAVSRGEYLNGQIIAAALGWPCLDPARCIKFHNTDETAGRYDIAATDRLLGEALADVERAVIPGFYGSATADGDLDAPEDRLDPADVRTFSRGGSDISGSLVARVAPNAERPEGRGASVYENWSDVNGLLLTDPRIVPDAAEVETITYAELRELSYMGAVVMHDEAVFPVRRAGIPVNIRNTNDPDHPGTMILPREQAPAVVPGTIAGIAGRKDFTVVAIEKAMMNAEIGFGRKVLQVFEDHGVSFEHSPTGIDTFSVVVSDKAIAGKMVGVLDDLRERLGPDSVEVFPNMALIATVGRGMAATRGMAGRLFTALADADVNVRMIDQGSSELNIIVGVEADDFETAVAAIYRAFAPRRSAQNVV